MRRTLLSNLSGQLELGLFVDGPDDAVEKLTSQISQELNPISEESATGLPADELPQPGVVEVVTPPIIEPQAEEDVSNSTGDEVEEEEEFAITFVSDAAAIPEPKLWTPPSGFSLPMSRLDRGAANEAALNVLADLMAENRTPTSKEREMLALYTGGVLPSDHRAFDPFRAGADSMLFESRLLGNSSGDREGGAYATMIEGIQAATERYAPGGANVLFLNCPAPALPSVCHPQFRRRARVTLHSLDPIAAAIASYLHEDVDVRSGAMHKLSLSQGYYDMAFLVESPSAASGGELGWGGSPHDFIRNLGNTIRPNGLFFGWLRRQEFFGQRHSNMRHAGVRDALIARAGFHEDFEILSHHCGASRHVRSDFLFTIRRSEPAQDDCPYTHATYAETLPHYPIDDPVGIDNLKRDVASAVTTRADIVFTPSSTISDRDPAIDDLRVPLGSYVRHQGKVYGNPFGVVREVEFKTPVDEAKALHVLEIRDKAREASLLRAAGHTSRYQKALEECEQIYDRFVAEHGPLQDRDNISMFRASADLAVLRSLERKTNDGWAKSEFFTLPPLTLEVRPSNPVQALHATFRATGRIDFEAIGNLIGITPEQARAELASHVFEEPGTGKLQLAAEYLSGDVASKLEVAQAAAAVDPRFRANVENLKKVLPEPIPIEEISFSPASPWMPKSYVQRFAKHVFGEGISVTHEHGSWSVTVQSKSRAAVSTENNSTYAIHHNGERIRSGAQIFKGLLTRGGAIEIRIPDPTDGKPVLHEGLSIVASEKASLLRNAFIEWVRSDADLSNEITRIYNATVNRYARPYVDPDALSLYGLKEGFKPRKHQLSAIVKGVISNNLCLNHYTGAGKTFVLAAIANERLVRGYNNKIALLAPKGTLLQSAAEIQDKFPHLKVIIAGPKSLTKTTRGEAAEEIRNAAQCVVLMTFETFQAIPLGLNDGLAEDNKAIRELRAEALTATTKAAQKKINRQLEKLIAKRDKMIAKAAKDSPYTFEELGFDGLMVDEAHHYRNLEASGPSNLSTQGNQITEDFFNKLRLLREKRPNLNVVMATATMLNRSITELYNYQRYLQPEALAEAKIESFYDWVNTFCESHPAIASTIDGQLVLKPNYTIVNATELSAMVSSVVDTVMESDVDDVKRPKLHGGKPEIVVSPKSPAQEELAADALRRVNCIRKGFQDPDTGKHIWVPASLDNPLTIYHDAILSAVDPRLVDPTLPAPENGKLAECAKRIANHAFATEKDRGVQLVFLDHHRLAEKIVDPVTGRKIGETVHFSAPHELIRMVTESGALKREECVFINDVPDSQLEKVYQGARAGTIRLLIGSGAKLGTGRNVQDRVIADHHLDIPWNPASIIQRNGRMIRQGNMWDTCFRYYYITEGSGESAIITDCARKANSFSAIWRATRSERAIQDINDFEANINDLVAELTDPRSAQLLTLRSEVNTLITRKQVIERERSELERSMRWYLESREKAEQTLARVEPFFEKFKEEGGMDTPILKILTLEGKTYESIDEANIALRRISFSMARDESRLLGTLAGLPLKIERTSEYWRINFGDDIAEWCAADELPNALVNITKKARANLPKIIESAQFDIERSNLIHERLEREKDRSTPLDEEIARAKFEYQTLLEDVEKRPSAKPPLDAYTGVPVKYNVLLSKPAEIPDGRRTGIIPKTKGVVREQPAPNERAAFASHFVS
jgi:DNA methylase